MVKLILDFGADINYYSTKDTYCVSAFYMAITQFNHPNVNVVKLLIKRGANQDLLSFIENYWFSLIHDKEIAKLLLSKGMIPTQKDIDLIIRENSYSSEDGESARPVWIMRFDLLVIHGHITDHSLTENRLEAIKDRLYPIHRLFEMIVMHTDNYHVVKEKENENVKRFFTICDRLPLDLQLVVTNVVFGRDSEKLYV